MLEVGERGALPAPSNFLIYLLSGVRGECAQDLRVTHWRYSAEAVHKVSNRVISPRLHRSSLTVFRAVGISDYPWHSRHQGQLRMHR